MALEIQVEGIKNFESFLDRLPDVAKRSASMAINQIAGGAALRLSKAEIEKQVAFPSGYLNTERLRVTQKANPDRLEAQITARQRPTSLARFAAPGQSPESTSAKGGQGVLVTVHPGHAVRIRSAFLIRLNKGPVSTKDNYNLGIAIRASKAEAVLKKKEFATENLKKGLYVLYGPSVDQVFQSVAADVAPEVAKLLGQEFLRQFIRLSGE